MTSNLEELIAADVDAAESADDTPDAALPSSVKVTRGHDRAKVLQVRLNEDEHRLLSKHAEEAHLPLSTFVRSLLLRTIGD